MKKINPYSSFLPKVNKPARYIGGEHNAVFKDWNSVKSKIVLCFPDVYEIGMSHLGLKILYAQVNQWSDLVAERCFAPWPDMEHEIRTRGLALVSLESYRPLCDFDLIGFSLQHELSYTNILTMLDLGGIPIWQKDRKQDDPLVIGGGPCATHPEVLSPFFDLFLIGDGEELLVKASRFIIEQKKNNVSRQQILNKLSYWQGIYVPSCFETVIDPVSGFKVVTHHKQDTSKNKISRFIVKSLNAHPFPTKSPIPHLTAVFDRFSVELSRGCTEGCRFCQAGMIYRPVRERSPESIISTVIEGIKTGGFDEASLTCLSTADYSAITPLLLDLLDKVKQQNASLGLSSLRAYGMEPQVFDKLAVGQKSALTFAPEAGTERLRKVINKNISEDDILSTSAEVFKRGWQKMKLYFMIGLPTETDEDVVGIMETAYQILKIGHKFQGRNIRVTASVSTFIPKPHTPFQWSQMIPLAETERRQELLFSLAKKYNIGFRKHDARESLVEAVLARGDRDMANVIFSVWKMGGRFDGWKDYFDYSLWLEAFSHHNLHPSEVLSTLRLDGRLPWDHIDVGLKDNFLLQEWRKSLQNTMSPPCGKPAHSIVHASNLAELTKWHDQEKKKLVCYHCGIACDLSEMVKERKQFLTSLGAITATDYVPPKQINQKGNKKATLVIGGKTYRLKFSKLGPICFTSHLDLQKIMMRIFKRANVEVLFTHGYNPHPRISLGPALPLGINSLAEFMDFRVAKSIEDIDQLIKTLNDCSERGLHFYTGHELKRVKSSIQIDMDEMSYFYPVAKNTSLSSLETFCCEFLQETEILVESFEKKSKKIIHKNIRPKIKSIGPFSYSFAEEDFLLIAEIVGNLSTDGLLVTVPILEGKGIRPLELYKVLQERGLSVLSPIKVETRLK